MNAITVGRPKKGVTPENRFWANIIKSDGCWEWTGFKSPKGYGKFGIRDRRGFLVHRFCWELHFGPVPDGMCVLHKCDNRGCCNPDHLFLGTQIENMADMKAKGRGRSRRGEVSHLAKLTEDDVREIRNLRARDRKLSIYTIAKAFGTTATNISSILNRKTWRHI